MMSHPMEDAFAPIMAHNRAIVEAQTWGHLAPACGRAYAGSIVFAVGEYGDTIPVKVVFPDLPDSPWFFDDMSGFIQETEAVGVYRFNGTYTKYKNGSYRFRGKVRAISTDQ